MGLGVGVGGGERGDEISHLQEEGEEEEEEEKYIGRRRRTEFFVNFV